MTTRCLGATIKQLSTPRRAHYSHHDELERKRRSDDGPDSRRCPRDPRTVVRADEINAGADEHQRLPRNGDLQPQHECRLRKLDVLGRQRPMKDSSVKPELHGDGEQESEKSKPDVTAAAQSSELAGVAAQAAGADACAHLAPSNCHPAHLQVGQETPVDAVFRVAYVVSVLRRLPADLAMSGHDLPSCPNCTIGGS